MSDRTFEQLYKKLLVYAPELPVPLAQDYINNAYLGALDSNHLWSKLRKDSNFVIPAAYSTGTLTVAQGGTTVTGLGTVWTTAMVGRQLIVGGSGPYYDIVGRTSDTEITIFPAYGGTGGAGLTYSIVQVYLTVPSDFRRFLAVYDVENNWRLHVNRFSQELLDSLDAQRTTSGSGWVLAPTSKHPTSNLARYEIWPIYDTAKTLPYRYQSAEDRLSARTDTPIEPISAETIIHGALADIALWPGTAENPSPYFIMDLHSEHLKLYEQSIH